MAYAGQVFHIWKLDDAWEVRDGRDRAVIAVFDDVEQAIDWCKQVARELDCASARICRWEPFEAERA